MHPVKIMFFDIDGTLVDPATGKISDKTREALKRLREKGILLCVATGRPSVCLPDFGDLRFDAFCTFNGSLCYTEREIVHSDPVPTRDVSTVLENAAALGRPVSVAVKDRLVANGYDVDLADYYRLAGLELEVSTDFASALEEDIYQIMLGCRESDHEAILRGTEGVKLAVSWERAADVISATGGKGVAICKTAADFGLDVSQCLAFGDSYNDIEMLQAAGTGVAMGNAAPRLKEVADDVCGPVSEDGIYHYCVEHGLID